MIREMVERNSEFETPQLYDAGEENWLNKLHVGCGSIYLRGYENLDAQGFLASDRPDLVADNATIISDYYSRRSSYTSIHDIPPRPEIVADRLCSMDALDYEHGTVDKIVCVQALEHVAPGVAEKVLEHWHDSMQRGGILIVSVPDTAVTIEMLLCEATRDFAVQHLAGTRRDKWSYHHNWFTHHSLELLLGQCRFELIEFLKNFHRYPAIVARAVRV